MFTITTSTETKGSAEVETIDIAIVGGGMVGLSLALLLALKNVVLADSGGANAAPKEPWRIRVIERFAAAADVGEIDAAAYQSSFDARSTALARSSEDILRAAGIWPLLSRHLTPIATVHVSDRGHFGGAQLHAREHSLAALGYVVENAWLGRVLHQAVSAEKSIEMEAPARVLDINANAAGYLLTLDTDGQCQQLQASLVVLAEGVDSTLRSKLGIEVDREDYQQTAVVTNVETDQPHRGVAYERFTDQGPMALLPLGEDRDSCVSALVWTQPQAAGNSVAEMADTAFLGHLQQRFGYRAGRFTKAGRRYSYPLQLQLAREQVRRSLVVMGNAAHFLHPVAGQGFNLALRDCAALTFALAQAEGKEQPLGDPAVLQDYLDHQSWDQWATVRLSDSLVRLYSNDHPAWSVLRNLGILALDSVAPANRLFARQAMGYALV